MDVKQQVTALPGRELRVWKDGGWCSDRKEDTAYALTAPLGLLFPVHSFQLPLCSF